MTAAHFINTYFAPLLVGQDLTSEPVSMSPGMTGLTEPGSLTRRADRAVQDPARD